MAEVFHLQLARLTDPRAHRPLAGPFIIKNIGVKQPPHQKSNFGERPTSPHLIPALLPLY